MSAMGAPQHRHSNHHTDRAMLVYLVCSITLILVLMIWQIATTGSL